MRRILILFVVLLIGDLVFCYNYQFRAITMDNGLSNFVVTSFYKDSKGFMWIGTDNCIDRFDGIEVRNFQIPHDDVNNKRIRCTIEANNYEIYAGNGIGLWRVDHVNEVMERVYADFISFGVNAMYWDQDANLLFLGTDKGLYCLCENENLKFFPVNQNALSKSNIVKGIAAGELNDLWLSTAEGIARFDKETHEISVFNNQQAGLKQNAFNKITRIGNQLFLATSNAGIIRFNIDRKTFNKYINVGSDIISDISSDGMDMLHVATDGNGVHFISVSQGKLIESIRYVPRQKEGIRSNSVYSLLVDRDGIIWIGFYQAGLDYTLFQNDLFKVYSLPPVFSSAGLPVRAFLIQPHQKIIGTREGLYFIKEKLKQVKFYDRAHLRSNLILSLKFYQGEYYVGTYGGGLSVLNPENEKVRPFSGHDVFNSGHIFHFEEDKAGNLWMATSGGVFRYNKRLKGLDHFHSSNSQLPPGNVYYIHFDNNGIGWIATENGMCLFDPSTNTIRSDQFPTGFFNSEIVKLIFEDTRKRLFFCSDKGHVMTSDINMRKFGSLTMTSRFENRIFLSIIEDENHNYWFGSDKGLISMKTDADSYRSYGFIDGIPDPVFNTDAAFIDHDGMLWFGNAKGLLFVDPTNMKDFKRQIYPIQFTGLAINSVKADAFALNNMIENNSITLGYKQNNINLSFVNLIYSLPGAVNFEYLLEGRDFEWKLLEGEINEVTLNSISPGKYVLRVRAEGDISSETALLITVKTFFSALFWIICFLVLILGFILATRIVRYSRMLNGKLAALSGLSKNGDSSDSLEKYRNYKLDEKECGEIHRRLIAYIEDEKPFIDSNLKQADLASALHISPFTLSYIFTQYLNKNYYELINEYRIAEFKHIVSETDDISKFTLTALAERCGFSSRASFFRSFKKITGITPSEFIRSQGKSLLTGE